MMSFYCRSRFFWLVVGDIALLFRLIPLFLLISKLNLLWSHLQGQAADTADHDKGKYALIRDPEDFQAGLYDKPLPCFGCGIGWFSFLVGFLCPPLWFYATILYFGNYYRKDPRERAGLGASAIAALLCFVALLIIGIILLLSSSDSNLNTAVKI